jgi:hypothetical protein
MITGKLMLPPNLKISKSKHDHSLNVGPYARRETTAERPRLGDDYFYYLLFISVVLRKIHLLTYKAGSHREVPPPCIPTNHDQRRINQSIHYLHRK